jgi:chromosome partitioning protein
MKTLVTGNRKGGVGKTTTTLNLGAILASRWNRKVLAIDLDDQGNLTRGLGVKKVVTKNTIYPVLSGFAALPDVVVNTYIENLYLCPANQSLKAAELELPIKEANDIIENYKTVLKGALEEVSAFFDVCLIDLSPSLGALVLNGLEAADTLLVPIPPGLYEMEGLEILLPHTKCPHYIVRTRYDKRQGVHRQMSAFIEKKFNGAILNTVIRENTDIQKGVADGKDVLTFDEQSKGARDYLSLTKELVDMGVV